MTFEMAKEIFKKGYTTQKISAMIAASISEAYDITIDIFYEVLNLNESMIRRRIETKYPGIHFEQFAWLDYIKEPCEETINIVIKNANERRWDFIGRRKFDYRWYKDAVRFVKFNDEFTPSIVSSLRNEGIVVIK